MEVSVASSKAVEVVTAPIIAGIHPLKKTEDKGAIMQKVDKKFYRNYLIVTAILMIFLLLIIFGVFSWLFRCDGEIRWETYTGILERFEIRCDICCHVNSNFKLKGQEPVWVLNCEKSLELIELNKTYIFYCEPANEEYAISPNFGEPSCYWSIRVYRIDNEYGYPIWERR